MHIQKLPYFQPSLPFPSIISVEQIGVPTYKMGPYQPKTSDYKGELTPVTHLSSAIYGV